MQVKAWEPLTEFEQMRRQMERTIGQLWGRAGEYKSGFVPTVEVFETDRDVIVNAELSGIDPKDVSVEVTAESVILTGEMKRHEEIQDDRYFRTEREYGAFTRVIALPHAINEAQASAAFKHGLLTVRAPLAQPAPRTTPRKVAIHT